MILLVPPEPTLMLQAGANGNDDSGQEVSVPLHAEAADMWDLPEAYVCIIRSQSESGKITEKAYRSVHAARKFVNKCLENEDELLILTENTMSVPFPTDGPESL